MRDVVLGPMAFTMRPMVSGRSMSTTPLVAFGMGPVLRSGGRSGHSLLEDVVETDDRELEELCLAGLGLSSTAAVGLRPPAAAPAGVSGEPGSEAESA